MIGLAIRIAGPVIAAIVATASWAEASKDPDSKVASVPLYRNLGKLHHPIATKLPQAQRYFDQGLRLTYAFNHEEAIHSFTEAARVDPRCAMCYWGIALAMGPNINMPMDPAQEPAAYEAVQKAVSLAKSANEADRAYITALATRYRGAGGDRAALDRAYADAMRKLARRYPADPDAATLFGEALMNLRPWDYWTRGGAPQPGTAELVAVLERVVRTHPDHPGACHYYIHAVEAVHPEKALPCAKRLAALMPGAGHLVHMPAHIYMRVGQYDKAVKSNAAAAALDEHYIEGRKPQGLYPLMYYPHNLHFLWAAATMEGRSAEALKAARALVAQVPDDVVRQAPPLELFKPTPYFALARFGRWQELLDEPAPPAEFRYTLGMWRYAQGLALAATGRLDEADQASGAVERAASEVPSDQMVGLNSAAAVLRIASHALAGELAARRGQPDASVARLRQAIEIEDGLTYDEPRAWYYPVRQSLGAVLLAADRPDEAEAVYREDLRRHPENGWSLYGLAEALRARGDAAGAAAAERRFTEAWARADVALTASRF